MTLKRMDNIGIVVEDLDAAIVSNCRASTCLPSSPITARPR